MEGILRNQIVYDLFGDPLPIDNDQVDSHIGHIGKWQADRTVYKCDALVREQLNHVIRNAKTKLRGELSRGENQACGFQLSERADKALAALSPKNNGDHLIPSSSKAVLRLSSTIGAFFSFHWT